MNVPPERALSTRECILLGAGGHAQVVRELAELNGAKILGVCDPVLHREAQRYWCGLPVLGGDDFLKALVPTQCFLLNGVGMLPGSTQRQRLFNTCVALGFSFPALIHPFAYVSPSAILAAGVQIMAGAVVQVGVQVDVNSIINTCSSVDHGAQIGAHCHVAPGAVLCGDVCIGDANFVGANATVIQGVILPAETVVRAGEVVTKGVSAKLDHRL
jgi:UDP-perosamine 4-acetyltransferase